MRRVLLAAFAATALIVPSAHAVPIHVHEKVPDVERLVTVSGKVSVVRTGTKIVQRTVHVAPADPDDNGIPGTQPVPEPEPVYTQPEYVETPTYTDPAVPTTSSSSCTPIPGEATSPSSYNPSSGASGCYQVIPSTAAAMGSACDDVNAASCLAAICAAQGNSAWAASGATPCG